MYVHQHEKNSNLRIKFYYTFFPYNANKIRLLHQKHVFSVFRSNLKMKY